MQAAGRAGSEAHYGPVVTAQHRDRIEQWIQTGVDEGAELVVDGRGFALQGHEQGFFIGPSLFDHVTPTMRAYQEEIFGPVLWFRQRDEPWRRRILREGAALLLTGVVVEAALMPIAVFHFHKAGLYGAAAKNVAIPLTTFVVMPLEAAALLADTIYFSYRIIYKRFSCLSSYFWTR
ncbi:ComEC/Rec2 family competence protein [Bacillus amyloliquefaciens]|uniref:ComEC/Rec2 family competence protein n=1 Tax=Bacillus amyloliquefaciens TaxID=1390 RepID=UPI00255BFBFF|nr:ComEC/Rec2 family competence protein [Bacillus amyloliquefaciens]WIX31186.1 ComEC/Rec2 family competence protein [Bacillus amyloliquefaciens]